MKLKRIAGLVALAPFLLLAGCNSTPSLSLSAYWYSNATNSGGLTGTSEQLVYNVTFRPSETGKFRAEYDVGRYTTSLKSENISYAEGSPIGYCYETELDLTGRYYVGGEKGEDFHDRVATKVWFLGVSDGLRPIRSERTVHCTAPNTSASSAADAQVLYEYTYVTEYDPSLSTGTTTYTATGEEPVVTKVSLGSGGTFLDNEQILFALRGLDMNSSFSFRTINPLKQGVATTVASVDTPSTGRSEFTFAIKQEGTEGQAEARTLDAATVSVGYQGNNGGRTQTYVYAKCVKPDANTYRNVLLHMETYALYSLGTFSYDLAEAQFGNK